MRTNAVIGAGQMGSGISQTLARNGLKVLLSDIELTRAELARAIGDYAALAEADLIIRAMLRCRHAERQHRAA